jgi:hypothetical protein
MGITGMCKNKQKLNSNERDTTFSYATINAIKDNENVIKIIS